jgi:glycosyltransferase involved in cell wall biosynthesis
LDIYVALSRQESFGVAVIEAGAAGRPVVVSNVGGLPEVVRDGETGFIVPPNDPDAAADALERLVRDQLLRRQMGEAGAQHVAKNYSWDASVQTMIKVLEATRQSKGLKTKTADESSTSGGGKK